MNFLDRWAEADASMGYFGYFITFLLGSYCFLLYFGSFLKFLQHYYLFPFNKPKKSTACPKGCVCSSCFDAGTFK